MDALEKLPPDRRNISSAAVTVDAEGYRQIVGMIEDLRSRILTRAAKVAHPDRVVQLNLQLIPLAGCDTASGRI